MVFCGVAFDRFIGGEDVRKYDPVLERHRRSLRHAWRRGMCGVSDQDEAVCYSASCLHLLEGRAMDLHITAQPGDDWPQCTAEIPEQFLQIGYGAICELGGRRDAGRIVAPIRHAEGSEAS